MSLMINVDDAVNVLLYEGIVEEDDKEWMRNELEQKSYIIMKRKSVRWLDLVIGEIDEVMNVEAIASHIADGTLKNWIETHKEVVMAKLEMMATEQKDGEQE